MNIIQKDLKKIEESTELMDREEGQFNAWFVLALGMGIIYLSMLDVDTQTISFNKFDSSQLIFFNIP